MIPKLDVPLALKFPLPIMPLIELFGIFTKPAALCVRLFANMIGGHMIVIVLTLLIFIFAPFGFGVASATTVVSMCFSLFMLLLDVLISFIQAYVFTMLSTLFISLAMPKEAISRRFTLNLRKEQAADLQDDSLFLADLPSLVEQHRYIVEIP